MPNNASHARTHNPYFGHYIIGAWKPLMCTTPQERRAAAQHLHDNGIDYAPIRTGRGTISGRRILARDYRRTSTRRLPGIGLVTLRDGHPRTLTLTVECSARCGHAQSGGATSAQIDAWQAVKARLRAWGYDGLQEIYARTRTASPWLVADRI